MAGLVRPISRPRRSRLRLRTLAAALPLALAATLAQAPVRAAAADPVIIADRDSAVAFYIAGGPSERRAAETALLGSGTDLQTFFTSGRRAAEEEDQRAAAQVLAGMDGPALRTAALNALSGSAEDVRRFVNGGWESAWAADERTRAYRILNSEAGVTTKAAAERALGGSAEDLKQFMLSGREDAAHADDRLAATRMLTGGPSNSGPVLNQAASAALTGSREELREFLEYGQFVARARDQELASIRSLTEQARQAGETTAREALAATEYSTRAANAAEEAKKAAQSAQAEATAAGGAAAKASAAAGRAADAAEGAADAAREAIAASNAAMRAARVAADASRRAVTAASLTAQAAARAQRAAAAARANAGDARTAREAAEAARDAAAKARDLERVKAERDQALAQAAASARAAKAAGENAGAAANAADEAGRQSGVSSRQAARARAAAADARRAAGAADRAADRAESLAATAAAASDQAFKYAGQAAQHAENAQRDAVAAADAADRGQYSATESARHAAAAVTAANTAVAASQQAAELERVAREEDASRLAEAKEQGILAAQEALTQEQETKAEGGELASWNRKLLWDTAEDDRVDPATRTLLNEAAAVGTPAAVMLDKGRRAAMALLTTGGDWTRTAAGEALAGGEVEMRSWLETGRRTAAGQDDRARVWHLIDTLPDGPEKTAAQTSLNGDDAVVANFLRTRNYAGKVTRDRQTAYAILNAATTAGQVNLKSAAEKALAGTSADLHRFLREGQHVARSADERIEAYRVIAAGGPEVKAAGEVALAGPDSYVSYFLRTSRYQAAQRDAEQAAHIATVRKLLLEAQQYAQKALEDAARATEAALKAQNKADEAKVYAAQADKAAGAAADHANNARASAEQARASAEQAAQSANTARNAANSAQASANDAARSATTATAASRRAKADAAGAYEAARSAREAATAAGKDAVAADLAAKQAVDIYNTKLKEFEAQQRSTAAGSGPDGNGTALDNHKTWGCLNPDSALSAQCRSVFTDFAGVLIEPAKCSSPTNSGKPGCSMLRDLKTFVDQNPDLLLDMLQFVLGMCGLVPGAGEVCDAADAAVSFGRGDWVGGLLSVGAMVPFAGYLASGAKAWKNSDKLRNVKNVIDTLMKRCGNSFLPGTPVLLADGRRKPIEEIRPGDRVLATDPVRGVTAGKAVTALIAGAGVKQLVDVTVDTDGGGGSATGTFTATENHRVWVPELRAWVGAGSLEAGQWLRTSAGTWVQVSAVAKRAAETKVHNLTVADFHSYYVVAGGTPVLVHNDLPCKEGPVSYGGTDLSQLAFDHRMQNRVLPGQNVAVFELDNGELISTANIPGGDHSEEIIDKYLRDRGVDPDRVTRVYSERSPCSSERHACAGRVGRYRNAKVTWTFTDGMYDSAKTRAAISRAMGNGRP
jgi:hypothetical protein